tara:strand:+ start:117 stop:296 length:180 start_codon:yes stop_codon:yes gene_type:complete
MLQVRSVNKLINYGYFESFNRHQLRVDWIQQALNALLKVYHYNVVLLVLFCFIFLGFLG